MSAENRQMLDEFQLALESGIIVIPTADANPTVTAGGVNYCPNSDLKYSKLAVTTPGTTPTDAGDENHECYRFYRQEDGDPVDTADPRDTLKAVDHSEYAGFEGTDAAIPIWDRVNGQIKFGASAAPLWDVAVQLYNNECKPGDRWYASFVLGALAADLVPADLEMYCGIWIKTASYEGWAEGGNFLVSYSIVGVKGTQELNYLVVAKTDSGDTLYSQIVNVTDAPNVIDGANFPRLSYGSASGGGFIQFEIYREKVASGTFARIADIRNTNQILFDDIPNANTEVPVQSFPVAVQENTRAYASSRGLDVGTVDGNLLTNAFSINIPVDYNISETLPYSQFFRFGFLRPCAVDRHIRLDKIYLGPTYNQWSDSPFDPKDVLPSTTQTGGTPVTGGGPPPDPGTGGGVCILTSVPVLRLDFDKNLEFAAYQDIRIGDPLEIGREKPNVVLKKRIGKTRLVYKMEFTNGVTVFCNKAHGFCLDKFKKRAKSAEMLKTGNKVWAWNKGKEGITRVKRISRVLYKNYLTVGTFSTTGDHSYVCGFSRDNESGVFCPNVKPINQD